ncbi:MAG: hypothetical protein K6T31_10045 [Alicyclobacillus sp.]|nr:hypothetical protein [Alicyclobacillus sp.]
MISKTLFSWLGGEAKLDALIDDFMQRVQADPDLGPLYPDDVSHLKPYYKHFAMELLGGPKRWSEQHAEVNLEDVHAHLDITQTHADAMLRCASATLANVSLPAFAREAALQRVRGAIDRMLNSSPTPGVIPPFAQPDSSQPWQDTP